MQHCIFYFVNNKLLHVQVDPKKHTLAKYFMELCLIDYQSVKFLPSEIAAAALCLSIKAVDDSEWVCIVHLLYMSHDHKSKMFQTIGCLNYTVTVATIYATVTSTHN